MEELAVKVRYVFPAVVLFLCSCAMESTWRPVSTFELRRIAQDLGVPEDQLLPDHHRTVAERLSEKWGQVVYDVIVLDAVFETEEGPVLEAGTVVAEVAPVAVEVAQSVQDQAQESDPGAGTLIGLIAIAGLSLLAGTAAWRGYHEKRKVGKDAA